MSETTRSDGMEVRVVVVGQTVYSSEAEVDVGGCPSEP
jgi:hypothetical protein